VLTTAPAPIQKRLLSGYEKVLSSAQVSKAARQEPAIQQLTQASNELLRAF